MGKSTVLVRTVSVLLLAFLTTATTLGMTPAEHELVVRAALARASGIPVEVLLAEEVAARATGASSSSSAQTPTTPTPVTADDKCSICFAPLGTDESTILRLSCGHAFHTECIMPWLNGAGHNTCAMCRKLHVPPAPPTNFLSKVYHGAIDWGSNLASASKSRAGFAALSLVCNIVGSAIRAKNTHAIKKFRASKEYETEKKELEKIFDTWVWFTPADRKIFVQDRLDRYVMEHYDAGLSIWLMPLSWIGSVVAAYQSVVPDNATDTENALAGASSIVATLLQRLLFYQFAFELRF